MVKIIKEKKMFRFFVSIVLFLSVFFKGENVMANALSPQQLEIVTVAVHTARGEMPELKNAIENALNAGITVNELKEILVQSYAYCGFPRSLNALGVLMQVAKSRGNIDTAEKDLTVLPSAESLNIGTQNQTKLIGSPVTGELFQFAPVIDTYLKAHLFGDIFARDTISWQTRELATVAMLAARDGVESQLNSHINIALHNGLTEQQVSEILNLVQKEKAQTVLFGFGKENTAYAQYFIGKSYLNPLNQEGVNIANVTFEPKCRNNWHIHHKGGQILLAVAGRGYYQEWGKSARELKAGDVVYIPPEVKHWHGAAKDSWFTHLALAVPAEGASNEWLEAVSDEEYNKLK